MNWITLAMACVLSQLSYAQYRSEKITYLDGSGNKTSEKTAVFVKQVARRDDTTWEVNLYQAGGPRVQSMQYSDEGCTILNGSYLAYGNGRVDTMGAYSKGKKVKDWLIFTEGRFVAKQRYVDGVLQWQKDTLQLKNEDTAKASPDNTFTKVEKESTFPG